MHTKPIRINSIDALRGFDMFWIMGAEEVFHQWHETQPNFINTAFKNQLTHTAWHGFTLYDLIFPLFLFISGVAVPFSINLEKSKSELIKKILKRGLILVVFGVIYNLKGFQYKPFEEIRFASVLGHIGIAWVFASIIYVFTQETKKLLFITAGILLGYWALLSFSSAVTFEAGDLTFEGNFASQFDRWFLPGRLHGVTHDPEGLLSKIPAVGSALLGIVCGLLLKDGEKSNEIKLKYLLIFSGSLLIISLLWNQFFPINKNIWTSSFACLTSSLSFLLVAISFYLIDMRQMQGNIFKFFKVIGANSILIYMSDAFIDWEFTASKLVNFTNGFLTENWVKLLIVVSILTIKWIFLKFFYDKKIFLKV